MISLETIQRDAAKLCDGAEPRTMLVAMAMHAHICGLSRESGWPSPNWYRRMAREAVKAADAALARLGAA